MVCLPVSLLLLSRKSAHSDYDEAVSDLEVETLPPRGLPPLALGTLRPPPSPLPTALLLRVGTAEVGRRRRRSCALEEHLHPRHDLLGRRPEAARRRRRRRRRLWGRREQRDVRQGVLPERR